jgi:sirohydrochlorin ferrochelatase
MFDAIMLIAHGSRRSEANADVPAAARLLAQRTGLHVEAAYLELATPGISEAAAQCVRRGARCVKLLPYFLSSGAHAVEDLERHRQELAAAYPNVCFELCPPLGLHAKLIDVLCERLAESSPGSAAAPAGS